VDKLLRKVENADNVNRVRVGNFLMSIGRMAARTSGNSIPRGLRSIEIYDLSQSCANFRQNLANGFQNLTDGNGYETLMQVRENGNNVRIMMKKDERNAIRELVFFIISDNNPAVIRMSGRIRESELAELISQHSM
jgi:hypothetical protein